MHRHKIRLYWRKNLWHYHTIAKDLRFKDDEKKVEQYSFLYLLLVGFRTESGPVEELLHADASANLERTPAWPNLINEGGIAERFCSKK